MAEKGKNQIFEFEKLKNLKEEVNCTEEYFIY